MHEMLQEKMWHIYFHTEHRLHEMGQLTPEDAKYELKQA
jgi:hypothetical protein